MAINDLIAHLASLHAPYHRSSWRNWDIQHIPSGNNRIFRATSHEHDIAVKFLIRDDRNRAEQEWNALTLLQHLLPSLGPLPVLCDFDHFANAVVVQTWLDGETLPIPLTDDATWLNILQAYASLHHVQRAAIERHGIELPRLVSAWPPEDASRALRVFAQRVPPCEHTAALAHLLPRLDRLHIPSLPATLCWCHGDPNIRNLLRTPHGVQLVDWEYTGYGDPAAEIALLMSHPLAQPTSDARWQWVAEHYTLLSDEAAMRQRIQLQYALRLAWWCIRLLIGHYVLLQQPSHRLVGPGAEAEISTIEMINKYFARTHTWLDRVK